LFSHFSPHLFHDLIQLTKAGILSEIDLYFARLIVQLASPHDTRELALAAALTSHFTQQGQTCIQLSTLANQPFPPPYFQNSFFIRCPSLSNWLTTLTNNPAVGRPQEYKPLILDDHHRLYLYRYWHYQQQLATAIQQRLSSVPDDLINPTSYSLDLERLFPSSKETEQKQAALKVLSHPLSLIVGGPGTGKTTLIGKILALLLEQNPQLSIALAAPTGKAAKHLQTILQALKRHLNCSPLTKTIIPTETTTLHQLLGAIPNSPYFRHHSQHPLPQDVIIVDEAAMIDLPLLTQLAQALKPNSRWILLGDPHQLSSLGVGSPFKEIVQLSTSENFTDPTLSKLQSSITVLEENFRFTPDSSLGKCTLAINQGQAETAFFILKATQHPETRWRHLGNLNEFPEQLLEELIEGLSSYFAAKTFDQALQSLEQFRILCALIQGPVGTLRVNRWLDQELLIRDRITKSPNKPWYHRCPITLTQPAPNLKLLAGEMGILWQVQGQLQAIFIGREGQFFPLSHLPAHELGHAITIHKSQGSEFEQAVMILPTEELPLLTRELIYTGMTRVRKGITIWGREDYFKWTVERQTVRTSGLKESLLATSVLQ